MKILILKPSSLGDVIHALPVLRLLKRHDPTHQVFWWLNSNLVPLLENDPDLSGLFLFPRQRSGSLAFWPEFIRTLRDIRRERFDCVIDLQGLARSGVMAWLANAQTSVGLDNEREGTREGAQAFYDRLAPRSPDGTHAVDRYLAVLKQFGVPVDHNFVWLPERAKVSAAIDAQSNVRGQPWIALVPGARWNSKRWPTKYFAEVVRLLAVREPAIKFAILGSREDKSLAAEIVTADPPRCVDLTGKTSLPELIEWIRLCRLVITNDTGPMHIAAAVRKPMVAVFGPTNPASTGPYGFLEDVLQTGDLSCVPCYKSSCAYREPLACLHAITPARVVDAVWRKLARLEIA